MESLALPDDLIWKGKMEPTSPLSGDLFSISESIESWLSEDNFANETFIIDDNTVDIKYSPPDFDDDFNYEEQIVVLEYDVKNEPWLEIKSSSPQPMIDFESLEPVFHQPSLVTKVQNPFEGANCNKTLYDNATLLTQFTPPQSPPQPILTPPQSPPQTSPDVKEVLDYYSLQQVNQQTEYQHLQPGPIVYQTIISAEPVTPISSPSSQLNYTPNSSYSSNQSTDIAQNCQIIDEIVENRAKELPDWNDECNSYFVSETESPPSQSAEEYWGRSSPSDSTSSFSSSSSVIEDSSSCDGGNKSQTSNSLSKKRTRPYGRGVEDRKIRKKEQNKNAATRYRQKKKMEMESVLSEEQALSDRRKELLATLAERKREAKYLKKLIREFCQNKKL